ncbi:MAG TPA: pyridoxamine 5'-phosphate oxidase family protein [Acidimicrobiia bacterium]|nr:pyridoxamine 5'-phosphate oxidase family protein [Acidimicrobiia bacterium]
MRPNPHTTLHPQFSSHGADARGWEEVERRLEEAELFWVSTVRPGGRPHVTPVVAVWHRGALYFSTGPEERKALNLADNPACVLTTGCNQWSSGFDVVVEGRARRVGDDAHLGGIADAYREKYGQPWSFDVSEGQFLGEGGKSIVFEVRPVTVFGFGKGEPFSQTRYRFDA